MYFPQEHPPGREAQIDFTHCGELKVTIAGQPYPHLLFQLVLSHSGWRYAEIAAGETFLALQQGLQNALWTLGGVPQILRSDNTSAATHEVKRSRGRALNDNYAALRIASPKTLPKTGRRSRGRSNRLVCQQAGRAGSQCRPCRTMLLRMVSSFLMLAVSASFLGFPTSTSRW